MKKYILSILTLGVIPLLHAQVQQMPAYPLVTHDPYFSIWSFTDTLSNQPTKHWTGATQSMIGLLKVDGKVYRFMGKAEPSYKVVLAAADEMIYTAQYRETKPAENWYEPASTDTGWLEGKAPFGNIHGANTQWKANEIWVRRTFTLNEMPRDLILRVIHDDNAEVFLNGKKIYAHNGWTGKFNYAAIAEQLQEGSNLLAVHAVNTGGNSWLDIGLVQKIPEDPALHFEAAEQKSVNVTATQTQYTFNCGAVKLNLAFTSPLLLNDLNLVSRPVSYVTFSTTSLDKAAHKVQLYLGTSANLANNTPTQEIGATKYTAQNLSILKAGTVSQEILAKKGDDLRIDWGYIYVAAAAKLNAQQSITTVSQGLKDFATGNISTGNKLAGKNLTLNTTVDIGNVTTKPKETVLLLGYDDQYAVQYFQQNLRPWWNNAGTSTIETQLAKANADYSATLSRCAAFDKKMYSDAVAAGGEAYAKLCVAAYRQSIAAHKLVKSPAGEMLFLSKENFSNGSINTVDVTYPSAPLYLLYNPDLLKGMLNGIFYFTESGKWTKPFAAHDLGTYPLANGQTYGGDMPVEESGNMLILTAAIAKREGNASYAKKHWTTLTAWAEYLAKEGLDPVNQLCTDDFAGHLARNVNLSAKAIVALRSYAMLAGMLGYKEVQQKYTDMSADMVNKWMQMSDDGDHFSLTFSNKNTWSQKYNLVWDKVLGFNLFPPLVYEKEIKYYLTKQKAFGLPLDSRKTYTKSDWIIWTAVLTSDKKDFKALVDPLYYYLTHTPSRVPLSDWHETTDGKMVGFQARSVVGGYFMQLLYSKTVKK
ncbi:MAG: DUF4965 domain-containing protein [Filimonas sp.]|nr:DUF4965 domain-containing protein [Filimonas sp.]